MHKQTNSNSTQCLYNQVSPDPVDVSHIQDWVSVPGSQPSRPDNDNDFDLENYDDFDQDNDDDFDQDDDDGDNFS